MKYALFQLVLVLSLLQTPNSFIRSASPRYDQTLMSSSLVMQDPYGNPNSYYTESPKQASEVVIESPGINTRKITASIIVDGGIEEIWSILTDYNKLSTHVPNLVKSYTVPTSGRYVRLFQEGSQKIIGFDFRASLLMDMLEEEEDENTSLKERILSFKLVESQMFSSFDGTWTVKYHSRVRTFNKVLQAYSYQYRSKLTYSVFVRPKGPVPVVALEWRIREDIPVNLVGIKTAVEKNDAAQTGGGGDSDRNGEGCEAYGEFVDINSKDVNLGNGWGVDETLGSYM